jgi:hypothetical protein
MPAWKRFPAIREVNRKDSVRLDGLSPVLAASTEQPRGTNGEKRNGERGSEALVRGRVA